MRRNGSLKTAPCTQAAEGEQSTGHLGQPRVYWVALEKLAHSVKKRLNPTLTLCKSEPHLDLRSKFER